MQTRKRSSTGSAAVGIANSTSYFGAPRGLQCAGFRAWMNCGRRCQSHFAALADMPGLLEKGSVVLRILVYHVAFGSFATVSRQQGIPSCPLCPEGGSHFRTLAGPRQAAATTTRSQRPQHDQSDCRPNLAAHGWVHALVLQGEPLAGPLRADLVRGFCHSPRQRRHRHRDDALDDPCDVVEVA